MDKQCVLNHPYRADLAVAMVGEESNAKTPPLEMGIPGEIVRDSDGRQKMVMNIQLPGQKEPLQMVMIFDPPAGKVMVLDTHDKKVIVRQMPQVHCAAVAADPDFSELTKAGMKVTELGTKDFGDLRGTGYKLSMEVPVTGPKGEPIPTTKPAGMEMEFWIEKNESIPLSMTMHVADAMNMQMQFTHVKLGEPSPEEFKVPADYTRTEMPGVLTPAAPAAP
jgi:outer membrane lipoprotein-sorting protein